MASPKAPATIREHIEKELTRIKKDKPLFDICDALDKDIQQLIRDADDHLTKISGQMPDYDKHDASHSERVLHLIEKLLGSAGIKEMPFLEAELLLLCCHFHDTGMAVPDWCFSLLRKTEAPEFAWHKSRDEVKTALRTSGSGWTLAKAHSEVKELFLVPRKESDFYEWLTDEIWSYELYRQGLEPWDGKVDWEQWVLETREEHLRSTHGKRSGDYARNIGKVLSSLSKYSAIQKKLALSVGAICCAHTQPVDAVWKLVGLEAVNPGLSSNALTYNPEFLAMLLRLGDVLDFSEDRASRTLYVEHNPMNRISNKHWLVKNLTGLSVEVKSSRGKSKQIRFMGSFSVPEHYYFIQDYLRWADDELKNYARFVETMGRDSTQEKRYNLSLPREVDRTAVEAYEFTPDHELKFTLEQRQIIDLLMGARLYSDSFTCLRELYQNALDASRCMQAENFSKGIQEQLPIVFGLDTDEETGRKFLYCRDCGIGMTRETVKKYLLRVGNSYYRSAQFRRDNALWGNAVHPVSEFGIGLLSCYMIGDRIEILTRHCREDRVIWVCMETAEEYGYFRDPSPSLQSRLGSHGTEVRVYLKKASLEILKDELPESREAAEDAIALACTFTSEILHSSNIALHNSHANFLWYRLQSMICVPETNFPVSVCGKNNQSYTLEGTHERYPLESRLDQVRQHFGPRINASKLLKVQSLAKLVPVSCTDLETGSEVRTWLYLPTVPEVPDELLRFDLLTHSIGFSFCVDGLAMQKKDIIHFGFPSKLCWNWKGDGRPKLSVSRDSISNLPESFFPVRSRLLTSLYKEINTVICKHFKAHPEANAQEVRSFLLSSLFSTLRFSYSNDCLSSLYDLWRELSSGIFREHAEAGLPFSALQDEPCCFSLIPSELSSRWSGRANYDHMLDIAPAVLLRAKNIRLDPNVVTVEMDEKPSVVDWNQHIDEPLFYRADCGTRSWENWDIHTKLLPFVSPTLFQSLSGKALGTGFGKEAELPPILFCSALLTSTSRHVDSTRDKALPQLKNNGFALEANEFYGSSIDASSGAPLLFGFLAPAALTENTKQVLQTYASVPEYVRGVQEGWSVLLFPMKHNSSFYSWILAPGIVDRFEMARHIPNEIVAEAAASGFPLRFTDNTLAFPDS